MKKIFVSMMLAVALIAGGTAVAQTQTDGTTGASTQTEYTKGKKGEKKDKKGKKDNKNKKGGKDGRVKKDGKVRFNPFEGVQLTDAQQQKLQVLQQGLGPVKLTPEEKAKIKENPNLTPEQKAQLKAERKAKKQEAKKNYLKGVKETLTPDQYVIFLENCYLYAPQGQGFDKGMKGHQGKDGKFNKGQKGDKGKKKGKTEGK